MSKPKRPESFGSRAATPRKQAPRSLVDSKAATNPNLSADTIGPQRLGCYTLECELGNGGMGSVHRAIDTRNGQSVALKLLFNVEPDGVYRLKREFRRMADIVHENLVALHELCHDDGRWFFTMELLSGRDLMAAMRTASDWSEIRELTRQLTRGVHALHQAGKIHRDLKPANVVVTDKGRVVVVDFGLVDEIDHGTLFGADGMIVGTPAYMAPEQAAGQLAAPASDWYAVGVILFEALTERWPFIDDPINDKLCQDAPAVAEFRDNVPPEMAELVASLLRRVPTERPGAAEILRWCSPSKSLTVRSPPVQAADLIEREAAMGALYDALHVVTRGTPACVDLVGEAGYGKSAVAQRFASEVAETGVLVLRGSCSPRESVPFRAFDGLLDAVTAHLCTYPAAEGHLLGLGLGTKLQALTQIFPVLARIEWFPKPPPGAQAEPSETRRRAFEGLKVLLHRITERRPTVLFLDNLQWGDSDSAYLLNHLFASPGVPPALFVLAYRRVDVPLLRDLALQRAMSTSPYVLREVELGPLSFNGTVDLVRRLRGKPRAAADSRLIRQIAQESCGNPALVRALVDEVERAGGDALTPPGDGDLLRRLVRSRLARVSEIAREFYGRVVVADTAVSLALLQQTGNWPGDIRGLVAPLVNQGLVRYAERDASSIESASEPLQHAALSILPADLLRRSHGELATAYIVANAAGAEQVARHLHAAGRDDEAVEHASAGAFAACQALAFERAAELYALALECKPNQWTLQKSRAEALVQAGRGAEAAPLFLVAAGYAPAAAAIRLKRAAAEHFFNYGYLESANEILRELLDKAGAPTPRSPAEERTSLVTKLDHLVRRGFAFSERSEFELSRGELDRIDLAWIAGKGLFLHDPLNSALFLVEGTLLALDAGEPRRIARSLGLCGLLLSSRNVAIGARMLDESRRIATAIRDHYSIGLALLCKGIVARHQGQWRTALADIDLGVQYLRDHCPGSVWECGLGQASTMAALEAMGELRVMRERSESLYQRAHAIGDIHSIRLSAIYSALTVLAAGRPKEARARVRGALEHWPRGGFQLQDLHALKIGVYCDLYERRPLDAWRRIESVWPVLEASGFLEIAARRAEALLLRARAGLAMLRGNVTGRAEIAEVIRQDIAQLEGEGQIHLRADARLLVAGLSACHRDHRATVRHLRLAKQSFDAAAMSLHADAVERLLSMATQPSDARNLARLNARMHMQNIADIDAWLRVIVPGLVD